jgi:hypothetical protein
MPVQRPGESAQSTHAFLTAPGATLGFGARLGCAPVVDPARRFGCGFLGRREGRQGDDAEAPGQGRAEEAVSVDGEGHDGEGHDGEGFGGSGRDRERCDRQGCDGEERRPEARCAVVREPPYRRAPGCTRTIGAGGPAERASDVGQRGEATHAAAPSLDGDRQRRAAAPR